MPRDAEAAASQVYALLVGGIVFLSALGLLLYQSEAPATDAEPADAASDEADANTLLDSLLGSKGVGWANGPDGVVRVGLGDLELAGLDLEHLDWLRGAGIEPDGDNGLVDHDELVASLGIDPDDLSIYLTIERIERDVEDRVEEVFPVTHAAYIGDWGTLQTIKVSPGTNAAMEAEARALLDARMTAHADLDRELLAQLDLDFSDQAYIDDDEPTILIDYPGNSDPPLLATMGVSFLEGDVYPDSKQYLDTVLEARLPLYDVLVVGTGVDHNALTSDAVKGAINDWVLAGGTLFVLGSASAQSQWLQPLFSLSVATEPSAGTAPDPDHDILNQPYDLQWGSYDHGMKAWSLHETGQNAHYADFDHVLTAGGKDVLSMAHAGAFQEGHITITTVLVNEVVADLGQEEAVRFLTNAIIQMRMQDDLDVSLAYGPEPPEGATVTEASRVTQVWDEDTQAWIAVRVTLAVWTDPVS